MADIIMSIHPNWADKIYAGEKKIEWRKTKPKWYDSKAKVYLYETAPVKKVTGYFMIERFGWVNKNDPDFKFLIREKVEKLGCVSIEALKEYQGNSPELFAWYVGKVIRFKTPRPLSEFGLKRPPQSWQYLPEKALAVSVHHKRGKGHKGRIFQAGQTGGIVSGQPGRGGLD